jgi:prephenate dehydrogenase
MRLNVGLVGLGRLGKVYARDLSSRLANTRLTVVADVDATLAAATPAERQSFLDGLSWLDTHCQQAHQAVFVKLTPEQQTAVLTALSSKSPPTISQEVASPEGYEHESVYLHRRTNRPEC